MSRQILLKHFRNPKNLNHFALIFTDYLTKYTPEFHNQIFDLCTSKTGYKAIAAPRGFAKSTTVDLIYNAWCALNGVKHFILLISDTYTQASMFLDGLRTEIETNELIKWLYPNAAGEIWSANDLIIYGIDIYSGKVSPCRILPKGAGMKVRGLKFRNWRPDLFIIDDLENDELVESQERRDKLRRWLLRAAIPALSKDGEIVYIGTILHFDSLLKNIMDKKDEFKSWHTLFFQAIIDGERSLWSEHYTVDELLRMRDDPTYEKYLGALTFAQEMQNEPIDDNTRILKPDWLNVRFNYVDLEREWYQRNVDAEEGAFLKTFFSRIIAGVDPAISEKTTADYFSMITIGIARETGHIYILDYFRDRIGDPLEQVTIILNSYLQWRHDSIKIEAIAYQAGLYQLVRRVGAERHVYPPISDFKPDKDKIRRAVIHSANFAGKLIHLREDHPLFNAFYNECIEFPLGKHDDMLDAYMNAAEETVIRKRARAFEQKPAGF